MRTHVAKWSFIMLLLSACGGPPRPPMSPTSGSAPAIEPAQRHPAAANDATTSAHTATSFYPPDEALSDALSGPLTFVGTGGWYGLFQLLACVYRNERVFVVDVYCTKKEMKIFEVDVFSPTRGKVRITAEGKAPVSKLKRADYITFKAQSELPATATRPAKALSLTMSYDELTAFDEARSRSHLPTCYGGIERGKPYTGCLKPFASHATEFAARNDAFFNAPPDAWYQLVHKLVNERKNDASRVANVIRTPLNIRARAEYYAALHTIHLYQYHMNNIGNAEGLFASALGTEDGGILMIGTKSSAPDGEYRKGASSPIAARFDATGKRLWETNLRNKSFLDFEGGSAVATADGGFIVFVLAYAVAGAGPTTRLVKLDARGKLLWDWVGRGRSGPNTPFATKLQLTSAGNVVMKGHVYLDRTTTTYAWSGEVDANGKLLRDEVGGPIPYGMH